MDVRSIYVRSTEAYMELIKSGQIEPAKKMLLTEVRETQRNYMAGIEEIITFQTELAKKAGKEAAVDSRFRHHPHWHPADCLPRPERYPRLFHGPLDHRTGRQGVGPG